MDSPETTQGQTSESYQNQKKPEASENYLEEAQSEFSTDATPVDLKAEVRRNAAEAVSLVASIPVQEGESAGDFKLRVLKALDERATAIHQAEVYKPEPSEAEKQFK